MSRISLEQARIRRLRESLRESLPAYKKAAVLLHNGLAGEPLAATLAKATRYALPQVRQLLQSSETSPAKLREAMREERARLKREVYELGWLFFLTRPDDWARAFAASLPAECVPPEPSVKTSTAPAAELRNWAEKVVGGLEGAAGLAAVA